MNITKKLQSSLTEELTTGFYRYLKSSNGYPYPSQDSRSARWDAGYYIGFETAITMIFGGAVANQIGDDARKEAYRRYTLLKETKENQA